MSRAFIIHADARRIPLPDKSIHCVVTSPPYWGLRDYGLEPSIWGGSSSCEHQWAETSVERENRRGLGLANSPVSTRGGGHKIAEVGWQKFTHGSCQKCGAWRGCLGLEPTPEMFVAHMVEIMREVWRVLRDDGTLWLNIGDSYATKPIGSGSTFDPKWPGGRNRSEGFRCGRTNSPASIGLKHKDLVGIPWLLAFALRADGWYLRQDIIWHKPNPMPESITDRCTKSHEYIFLLTKSAKYFYDADAIREPVTSTGGASFGPQTKQHKKTSDGGHAVTPTGDLVQSRRLSNPEERNNPLGRNKRDVWTLSTQSFPEAHFATFPIKLPTLCIKAGTSEKGCCPYCGAPWKRVVERIRDFASGSGKSGNMPIGKNGAGMQGGGETKDIRRGPVVSTFTTAWLPSCKCPAHEPIPCTVLDPFSGAASTGVAAQRLGRNYVGIERKAEYIDIARRRLIADAQRPEKKSKSRRCIVPAGQGSLFGMEAKC